MNRVEAIAQGPQGLQDTTSVGQQRVTEVTLENLKQVMRCVAKEVFEESRGSRLQREGAPADGESGKRRHWGVCFKVIGCTVRMARGKAIALLERKTKVKRLGLVGA